MSVSAFRECWLYVSLVTGNHQVGQVLGLEERRGWRRPPLEQALRTFEDLRRPQGVLGDAVHVAVVLGEVSGRVLEIPEEVAPRVVAAQSPDMTAGVGGKHVHGSTANLVDI